MLAIELIHLPHKAAGTGLFLFYVGLAIELPLLGDKPRGGVSSVTLPYLLLFSIYETSAPHG